MRATPPRARLWRREDAIDRRYGDAVVHRRTRFLLALTDDPRACSGWAEAAPLPELVQLGG